MQLLPNGNAPTQSPWRGLGTAPLPRPISSPAVTEKLSQPRLSPSAFIVRRGAAVLALLVGTGGLSTSDYIIARSQRGYGFDNIDYSGPAKRPGEAGVRSPSEALARIREMLSPSVTDLAFMLNVSRQTIYNWLAGEPIAEDNADRLGQVASAADQLAQHGLTGKPSVLRRKFRHGKTFFELVRDGMNADELAQMMVATMAREQEERNRLASRLASRPRKRADLDEVGVPHVDERS